MEQIRSPHFSQLLAGRAYAEQAIFEQEMAAALRGSWQFVATTGELERPNDFVALELGGRPVVVQNMNGELKAFENICSHRRGRIQADGGGNRPLVCPYHSFSYDERGCPEAPARLGLNLTRPERELLRLPEFPLEVCGKFVFVHLGERPPSPLIAHLGDMTEHLLVFSRGMGEAIDQRGETIAANWKIVVENFLEFAHIPTVHQATFGRIGLDGSAGVDRKLVGLHSQALMRASSQRLASDNEEKDKEYLRAFAKRPFQPMGSHVSLVFPNLVLVSVFGLSFLLTSIRPEGPASTRLSYRLFEAKPDDDAPLDPGLRQHRREVLKAFAYKTIIDEDKAIVEALQRGTALADRPGILGLAEECVHHFQKNVLALTGSPRTGQ
jgi:phenylpropionate dioxygenase-like ring-hydroxylating dioxygenase large terminal subunit